MTRLEETGRGASPLRLLFSTTSVNMTVIAVSYAVFAWSLWFQPGRWAATPAYVDLLQIMPQHAWAAAFAAVAAALAVAYTFRRRRLPAVIALTLAGMMTTAWCAAFVIRWLTSPATTPETWVSWAVFDYLIVRSWLLLDFEEVRIPRADGTQGNPRG